MMARFRISLMAAALFGLATFGSGRSAEAAFRLTLSQTGSTPPGPVIVTETSPGMISLLNYNFGAFNITATISTSNATGTPSLGTISQSNLIVTNATGVAGQLTTLSLSLSDDTFTSPAGDPVELEGSLGGPSTLITGDAGSDSSGQPNFAKVTQTSTLISGASTTSTAVLMTSSNFPDYDKVLASRPAASYTLKQLVTISLGQGGVASFTATTNVYPVPEPTTIAMAGIGAVLSLGGLHRRKRS